jgi:hypothetical protein
MREWRDHGPRFQHMFQQGLAWGGRAPSGSDRPGAAATAGRPAIREGHAAGRGGTRVGSVETERHRVASRMEGGGRPGTAPSGADGAAAPADRPGAEGRVAGAAQGTGRVRLEDRALDAGACSGRDRDHDRHPVPRRPRVEDPAAAGLELAVAGPAGERARRGGDRALGAGGVAGAKKLARRKQRGDGVRIGTSSNSPTADADSGGKREFRPQRTAPGTF